MSDVINTIESSDEVKGIQESLLTVLDTKFKNLPQNINQIINSQNNAITLKEWLMRITTSSNIEEVQNIITTKENG